MPDESNPYAAPVSSIERSQPRTILTWLRWPVASLCWLYGTVGLVVASLQLVFMIWLIVRPGWAPNFVLRRMILFDPTWRNVLGDSARLVCGLFGLAAGHAWIKERWARAFVLSLFLIGLAAFSYRIQYKVLDQ